MKNSSVSLHFCLIIKVLKNNPDGKLKFDFSFLLILFPFIFLLGWKWSLFISLCINHLFSSLGNQFWIRLEAYHHFYRWKWHLRPLSKHCEWQNEETDFTPGFPRLCVIFVLSLHSCFSLLRTMFAISKITWIIYTKRLNHICFVACWYPPLVKSSCLCPGASSYSELSRASLCHRS